MTSQNQVKKVCAKEAVQESWQWLLLLPDMKVPQLEEKETSGPLYN